MPSLNSFSESRLPSESVRRVEVTLLGHSFSPLSVSVVERTSATEVLVQALTQYTSGLLKHHFPPPSKEPEDFICAVETILHTPAHEQIVWEIVSVQVLNSLAQTLFQRAACFFTSVPSVGSDNDGSKEISDPVIASARALHTANVLLEQLAERKCRALAVNTSPGQAIYAITAIRLSVHSYEHPQNHALQICEETETHLLNMRHVEDAEMLISTTYIPTIHDTVISALETFSQCNRPDLLRKDVAPLAHVIHEIASHFTSIPRLERALTKLLIPLTDLAEHTHHSTRNTALSTIQVLVDRLPPSCIRLHLRTMLPLIQHTFVWRHPATSNIVIPLLRTLSPHAQKHEQWVSIIKRTVDDIIHHMQARNEDDRRLMSLPDVRAAVDLAEIVAATAKEYLLRAPNWFHALSAFLPRVANLERKREIPEGSLSSVSTALQTSLRWSWPTVAQFRREVFEGCMAAVMEGGDVDCLRFVLVNLARCGGSALLLEMIREIKETAHGYPSLAVAEQFMGEVEDMIVGEHIHEEPVQAGRMVGLFFPELGA